MATSVNIGDDLKSYLASSSSGGGANSKSNGKLGNFFKFNQGQKASSWLYSPLGTADPDDDTSDGGDVNLQPAGSKCSCFENLFPALSRTQRLIGFAMCLGMGFTCFILASMYIPILLLKARKFALLFTLGSFFVLSSFSFLSGPWNHIKHLFSKERLPFSLCYLGTLVGTLYAALSLQSTPLTVLFALFQVIALVWYLVSYIPGGQQGLSFFTKVVTRAASRSLPV